MIRPRTLLVALLLAAVLIAAAMLRPLLPIDETRYLDVAWEMRLSGDPVHLTRNFDIYTHKPPLLFWLINLVWLVTGVSEFFARLVGPAFAVASVVAVARLARRLWPDDPAIGGRAALVLSGFTVFVIFGGATMFDTMLTFATILGAGLLWRIGQGARGLRPWLLFGAVLAFGIYAKGPVIFVHLVPMLLLMPLWAEAPPSRRELLRGVPAALLIAAALVALWLVPALLGGDAAYREELLWTQSAARVAGGLAHDRPVWFLVALLPLFVFPWGWNLWLWPHVARVSRGERAGRLAAIWALSGLVLFSLISGKQAHYLLPEYPALALLFARAAGAGAAGRRGWAPAVVLALLGGAAMALAVGVIPAKGDLATLTPALSVALFAASCLLIAGFGWRLSYLWGNLVIGLGLVLAMHVLVATTGLSQAYDATAIVSRLREAEVRGVALTGMPYNAEFNFAARLTHPIATPRGKVELRQWAVDHPDGLVFGPVARAPIKAEPEARESYNHITYGFWPASALIGSGSD